jgi:RHS repeat-associated protein
MDTAKGYTGQYADTLTGLDYYVSRYYDPVVGIFLSADDKEGNAQGMNPYAYVGGNPETMSDPSGQMVYCPGCGNGTPPPSPPPPNHGPVPCVGQDCGSNPPHQPKSLNPKQLAAWCVQNVQCMYAVQEYDDAQQSAYDQNILQFGMGFFEFFDGDPDAFEQAAEEEVNVWEVLAQDEHVDLNAEVQAKLASSSTSDNVEGQLGATIQDYSELIRFNQKFGPDGMFGEIDAQSPEAIFEAKSGGLKGQMQNLRYKFNNRITNPNGEPFVIFAPDWNEKNAMTVYENLGSLDSGRALYVTTNVTQLIEVIEYLQEEGPPF